MKKAIGILIAILALCGTASAWDCNNPLDGRVDVGTTKPSGTAGDGDGQYFLSPGGSEGVAGHYYVCQPAGQTTPAGGSNAVSGSQSNSNSQSTSNSNSTSGASSSSNATGGAANSNSNATGGKSTARVSNSGNSTVSVSPVTSSTATGGAGGSAIAKGGNQSQQQTQNLNNSGNSSAAASNNGNGSNNSSFESVTNVPRDTATAYAPTVYPTATCFKGLSAGAQGPMFGASFGGGKIDQNCAILEAAVKARNIRAFCMVYITDKFVKAAGVTLEDCIGQQAPPAPVIIRETVVPVQAPPVVTVNVPAPVVTIIPQPAAPAPTNVVVAAKQTVKVPHSTRKCYTEDELAKLKAAGK